MYAKPSRKNLTITSAFVIASLVLLCSGRADAAIGKITALKGTAIIQSGTVVSKVTQGAPLNNLDSLTTQNGEVSVTFNDGAVMKVNPYTSVQVREQVEQSGVWIFKTNYNARRITCMVGKIWFKSGASGMRNHLQSATAVVTLKGSDADFGYNNLNTYLNMYSGDAAVVGNVIRGFFENPGIDAATKNNVYQALAAAYQKTLSAQASSGPLRAVNLADARIAALQVARNIASELAAKSPDATVRDEANSALSSITGSLTGENANRANAAAIAQNAGVTVPDATTTVPISIAVTAATTAAATTTSTTTSTTSTTSSISTTTVCPSPPCK